MKIDLTKLFDKTGKLFTNWLSQAVKRQQNYDSSGGYLPKVYDTHIPVKNKKTGKVHKRNVGRKRLYVTGNFAQNAFKYEANAQSLTVRGNPATHPSGLTYADIIAYNDAESPYLKGKRGYTIRRLGTKLFPWLEAEFIKAYKLVTGREFLADIAAEIKLQVEEQVKEEIGKKIEIKF